MKSSSRVVTILSVLLVMTSGCATAVNGRTQEVTFSSDPLGAAVFVDGTNVGITPTAADLTRSASHSIRIEKPGYIPYETMTVLVESGWTAADDMLLPLPFGLNLLAGPLLVKPADSKLGGAYDVRPTDVSAQLIGAGTNHLAATPLVPADAPHFAANTETGACPGRALALAPRTHRLGRDQVGGKAFAGEYEDGQIRPSKG